MELEEIFFEEQRKFIDKKGKGVNPQPIGKSFIIGLPPEMLGGYSNEALYKKIRLSIIELQCEPLGGREYLKANAFMVGHEVPFGDIKFYPIQVYKI